MFLSLTGVRLDADPEPSSFADDPIYPDLHILSIDPAAQGAGVGKRLLQSAIDLAVAENLPLTLESTECEQDLCSGRHVTPGCELMRAFSWSSWSAAVSLDRLPRLRRDHRC